MSGKDLLISDLAQFTGGSEQFYRHPLSRKVLLTAGAQYVAEHGGAYWFLDKIAILGVSQRLGFEPFQVWKLIVNPDRSALITVGDGNGTELYQEQIEWTDFPLAEITLWLSENTILLPSEY